MDDHETMQVREQKELVYGVAIYRLKNTNIRRTSKAKQRSKMKKLQPRDWTSTVEEKRYSSFLCMSFAPKKKSKLSTIKRRRRKKQREEGEMYKKYKQSQILLIIKSPSNTQFRLV